MSVMQITEKQHDDGWRVIKRALSPSDREARSFAQNAEWHIKFRLEKWQRYYEPSSDDLNAPVEGGLWIGEYSGRYPSLSAAERDAAASVIWFEAADHL
ncbi:hypothetical protein VHN57_01335 [Sphingobium sp. WW5]|uniref:hypothetical protein n=2 Tax=Sphingomonadaceae TaxID=41297 RepID=UPI003C174CDD